MHCSPARKSGGCTSLQEPPASSPENGSRGFVAWVLSNSPSKTTQIVLSRGLQQTLAPQSTRRLRSLGLWRRKNDSLISQLVFRHSAVGSPEGPA